MGLSYEALLELGTDGRIPPEARAAARHLDAERDAAMPRAAKTLLTPKARARDIVGEMARAICAAVAARQSVQVQDFRRIGIDDDTAREMFPVALKRARHLDRAVDQAIECVA